MGKSKKIKGRHLRLADQRFLPDITAKLYYPGFVFGDCQSE
jgi:hypothetical protein